jgi:transcriptional regulator with XRE-family HTH domain
MDHFATADHQQFIITLREVLKAKGFTYAALAKKLGVSEVTIKRWFTGKGGTLKDIFAICEAIGISFHDLSALAKEEEEIDYILSTNQEKLFAKDPGLFGFFKRLHAGENPKILAKIWKLDSSKLFKILRRLESVDLLEVLPGNQVRLKTRGTIRYSHQGPLAQAILRPQISQYLDHIDRFLKNKDVCLHSAEVELSENHIKEFVAEIHQLGAKYRARAARDKNLLPQKKLKPVRWLFAFAPYETNWQQYGIDI